MTTDNKDNKLSIKSSDYAEILRHAVAVIEHARTEIARHNEKVLRSVALLPWSHNMLLLSKGLNDEATLYHRNHTLCGERPCRGGTRTRKFGKTYWSGGLSVDSTKRKITESPC